MVKVCLNFQLSDELSKEIFLNDSFFVDDF